MIIAATAWGKDLSHQILRAPCLLHLFKVCATFGYGDRSRPVYDRGCSDDFLQCLKPVLSAIIVPSLPHRATNRGITSYSFNL
jgi:hypothetical protein